MMISRGSMLVFFALSLGHFCHPQEPEVKRKIGELVPIKGRYQRFYYHDVPFSWINDAEVRLMNRKILREKIQQLEETIQDRKLRNARPDNKFQGFMLSPYEAFRQGLAPGEKKGQWSTHWFRDYSGSPFDPICVFLFLYFLLLARITKTIRNWGALRRHLHPSGYLNVVSKVHLADIQQSGAEKACRPISRWSLSFMAKKFRITLDQPSTKLIEIYYRDEERNPHPDPWLTLKSIIPWLKQYKRIEREDKSIMAVAQKYGDKAGRTQREKAEIREAIFQKLKNIEKGIPLSWEEKLKRNYRMMKREDIKEEERKHRKEMIAAIEARNRSKREQKRRAEELFEAQEQRLLEDAEEAK